MAAKEPDNAKPAPRQAPDDVVATTDSARQGPRGMPVLWTLIWALVLAIVLVGAFLFWV